MSRAWGYGVASTNGARDFTGKVVSDDVLGYRFRGNDFNRRRYGGMWGFVILLVLIGACYG